MSQLDMSIFFYHMTSLMVCLYLVMFLFLNMISNYLMKKDMMIHKKMLNLKKEFFLLNKIFKI